MVSKESTAAFGKPYKAYDTANRGVAADREERWERKG